MRTEQLFKMLTHVEYLVIHRWDTVVKLVEVITKGDTTIKSKVLEKDMYRKGDKLDLSNINTWSTFENCIVLQFANDTTEDNGCPNNQLKCYAKIYIGNSFGGGRQSLRFSAVLWLPTYFIHNIELEIVQAFNSYLEDKYVEHLDAQKAVWVDNMKKEIINKT